MGVFPALTDYTDRASMIEREMERVFLAAAKEVALARDQIRRADDALWNLEQTRWLRSNGKDHSPQP